MELGQDQERVEDAWVAWEWLVMQTSASGECAQGGRAGHAIVAKEWGRAGRGAEWKLLEGTAGAVALMCKIVEGLPSM